MALDHHASDTTDQFRSRFDGQIFDSFADFEISLKAFESETYSVFTRRNATTVQYENKSRKEPIPERFRYATVSFFCEHFGKPVKRGTGQRKFQRYLALECPVSFTVAYRKGSLQVTKSFMCHQNHVLDPEKNRRPKAELGKKRPQSFSLFTTHSNSNSKRKVDIESDTALYSALPISFPMTHNNINNDTHHDEPHGSISIGNSSTLLSQSQVDPIAMSVGHHFGQQSECESPPLTGHHMVSPGYHALFQSYAHRMERLSSDRTRSFLQLQIAQLFFNAENPDLPPVPIMPLPRHSSSSTRQSSSHQRQEHHEQDQQTQQTEASSADQQTGRSGDIEHSVNGKVPIKIEKL